MWSFDDAYSISYRHFIVTDSLSSVVFEILGPRHIWVTTLTFQGHVTSSITWRFDSPYRVSLGAPLEPSPYLQAFSRYLAVNCLSNANRHCACAISRDLDPLCKIWVHIWISHPTLPIQYDTYSAPMKNKGCLLVRPKMLNAKSSENFLSPDQNWTNFGGLGVWGSGVSKSCDFYSKRYILA